MVSVRSVRVFTSTEAGRPAWIWGRISLMESTTAMTLAPGWRWTLIRTAGVLLAQLDSLLFSAPCTTLATSRQIDRRAVLVGHHDVVVGLGVLQLVVGVDGVGLRRAVEAALGRVGIVVGDGGAQIVDVQAIGRQLLQIGLHPHGRALAAGNADQADAGQAAKSSGRCGYRPVPPPW